MVLCCLNLMYVFKFAFRFGKRSGRLLGGGSHSASSIFSKYKYLIVNLDFPASVFGVGISF